MNSKMTFAATSLLLAGVLAVSYGCASSSDESGDTGGSSGSSSSSSTSAGGGGGGSSSSSSGGGGGGATPSGDNVVFEKGKAKGLFEGYGWVAMGKDDSLTSPTCDTNEAITSSTPCKTSTVWSKEDALCMSGSIPTLPAGTPSQSDYDNNWGVQIGVNAKEPSDAIGDSIKGYVSASFVLSGSPSSGLRAMFHLKGDPDGTTYCADSIKSDTPIKFTKFNTKCWGDPASVYLAEADVPRIDKAGVQVSSTQGGAIEVKDLCLSEIKFQK